MRPSNRQHGFHDVNCNLESQGIQPTAKTRCLLSRRKIKISTSPPTSLIKNVEVRRFFPFYWYKVRKRGFTVPFCFVQYWSKPACLGAPSQPRPMEGRLKRIVCKLSGNPLRSKAFLQKLPRLSSSRGGKAHLNSTNLTTKNGLTSVIENRLLAQLVHLKPKS